MHIRLGLWPLHADAVCIYIDSCNLLRAPRRLAYRDDADDGCRVADAGPPPLHHARITASSPHAVHVATGLLAQRGVRCRDKALHVRPWVAGRGVRRVRL